MRAVPGKSEDGDRPPHAPRRQSAATPAQQRTTPSPAASAPRRPQALTPAGVRHLQGVAGNAAVSRLVAQRHASVVKPPPAQAPGFRRVKQDIGAKKQKLSQHKPAESESRSAQDAAVAPPDDKEAQGKAANAEKMNAAEPGGFDKAAFIAAVNAAIAKQAPKNLEEADEFSGSGRADAVKGEVSGKVKDGKQSSAEEIETTTAAAPDTSRAKDKKVLPMSPDTPPANPGAPDPAGAAPDRQPAAVLDLSEGNEEVDRKLTEADVTEEQLAKSNEPQFTGALSEKRRAEQHTATAPAEGRAAESAHISEAKAGAAAAGAQAMTAMTADRAAAGKAVDGGKGETKSADERRRQEATARLQKVFDATQHDVRKILDDLDGKVDRQFTDGEKKARDAFTADHKRRMDAYKDKRYSGWTGKARWVRDKFKGLPQEGLNIFQESRKLYVSRMQAVISSVADTVGAELGRAKTRIAAGRAELKAEADKLPADLKKFGQEAAKDFAGKFDDLESTVEDKSQELVQTLATKYTQALNAVDAEIKQLQDENKGLVAKAKDAVVGVVRTIIELKNLLMGVLAKAAAAVTRIIKDPIGFLRNLVTAVGAGLRQFLSNIATHLQKGLVSWLLGTAAKAGLEIPAKFDLKGVIGLVASLLGLTWSTIRAKIVRKGVPEQAMSGVEQSVPVAAALAKEGPAGAVDEIGAEVGDLKTRILDDLKSYLIPTVIIAGITWIVSLLTPASAFVRAVKGIIDIVTFVVTQGAQIAEFVNSVLDAVIAIAGGGQAGVPKMIETALAAGLPLLIGFLAALVGVGGLAGKIRSVFQKAARPVHRVVDKLIDRIATAGKRLWNRSRPKPGKAPHGQGDDERRARRPREAASNSPENIRRAVSAELRASLPVGVDIDSVDRKLSGIYGKYRKQGLNRLRLVPDRGDPLSFSVLITASPESEGHHSKGKEEGEADAFEKYLDAHPEAKRVHDAYEVERKKIESAPQVSVDNLRLKTRKNADDTYEVRGQDTPTVAMGVLTLGSKEKEYKLGEFPSTKRLTNDADGKNHSEARLLKFMFDRWHVYTHAYAGEKKAHLELNVTRSPCYKFCTPKIIAARSGKDAQGGKDLPADWRMDITVNSMSVYGGAGENKAGEIYGRNKESIKALVRLVKAGVRLGIWTPASESMTAAWANHELRMYPTDGGIMSPPTRDEIREANIKMYKVLKQLVYTAGNMGQAEYAAMMVELPSSGGQKRKILKIPFAR
ncbi:hypothetical protein GCM10027168_19980 [Streptomyces capparidis]